MRSSCIQHPADEPMIVIRRWQIDFCEGKQVAAALLSFFEYWHNIKLAQAEKAKAANVTAQKHGDSATQDEGLWQFHTEKQLEKGVLIYKSTAIGEGIKFLENRGVIEVTRNPNPRYKFDRTRFFRFHPEVVNDWLRCVENRTSLVVSAARRVSSDARSTESDVTIPETTTETTTETTKNYIVENLGCARAASQGQPPPPTPTQAPATGDLSAKPTSPPPPVIHSEIPQPPTAVDLDKRQKTDFPPGVDAGKAAPGRMVKTGTGVDAYWVLREYTTRSLTAHQIQAIRAEVTDRARWRAVCARWAEVYGDDWRKFGHLDWYRDGIPNEKRPIPSSPPAQMTKTQRSLQAVDNVLARLAQEASHE